MRCRSMNVMTGLLLEDKNNPSVQAMRVSAHRSTRSARDRRSLVELVTTYRMAGQRAAITDAREGGSPTNSDPGLPCR